MNKAPDESPEVLPSPPAEDPVDIEWDVEVTVELDDAGIRHLNAFYALMREWFGSRDYTCILLTRKKHDEILRFCLDVINGAEVRSLFLSGNKQAYKWAAKYDGILVKKRDGVLVDQRAAKDPVIDLDHAVLVLRPKNIPVDAQSLQLCHLQQPTYAEKVFSDLYKIHKTDHCKGVTFSKRAKDAHGNVPRDLCKLFTDCCPTCISVMNAKRLVAGIKPLVTDGFGVRGQVNLIDF